MPLHPYLYPDDQELPCEDCQAPVGMPCRDWCPNGMSPYDRPY